VDGKGNVYIVTEGEKAKEPILPDGSGRVRKVSPDGTITLFAGSPGPGSSDMVLGEGGPARCRVHLTWAYLFFGGLEPGLACLGCSWAVGLCFT
jgi:hypothetical protein